MTDMGQKFTSNEGSGEEFVIPEEGVYTFQLTRIHPPRTGPNIFFDAYCAEHPDYDKDADPLNKKESTSIAVDMVIMFDEEWAGTNVRQYWNPSMGNAKYPSTLRKFAAAILKVPVDECDDADQDELENGYFQATLIKKKKQDGSFKAVVQSPVPYRRQGNRKPPKPEAAPPEPPPSEPEYDEAEFEEAVASD